MKLCTGMNISVKSKTPSYGHCIRPGGATGPQWAVVKWRECSTTNPGSARSIPRFSDLSNETLNREPVFI